MAGIPSLKVRFEGGPKDGMAIELRLPIPMELDVAVLGVNGRVSSFALYKAQMRPGLLPETLDFDHFRYVESRPAVPDEPA